MWSSVPIRPGCPLAPNAMPSCAGRSSACSRSRDLRPKLPPLLAPRHPRPPRRVWKLDRLGRSLTYLIETVTALPKRGVWFRSLTKAIDITTSGRRPVFHIFGTLGQSERNLIGERTRGRPRCCCSAGRRMRPQARQHGRQADTRGMVGKGLTAREIATRLKVDKIALYEALRTEPD